MYIHQDSIYIWMEYRRIQRNESFLSKLDRFRTRFSVYPFLLFLVTIQPGPILYVFIAKDLRERAFVQDTMTTRLYI